MQTILEKAIAAIENDPQGRVHGNGFIQIDIDKHSRLHIWGDPRIPQQVRPTPIHDHRFSFTSHCLLGRMINVKYDAVFGNDYDIYEPTVREGEDTVLGKTGKTLTLFPRPPEICYPGMEYRMRWGHLHETFVSGLTVTHMQKSYVSDLTPRVLCPVHLTPDNDFHRYSDENRRACGKVLDDVLLALKGDKSDGVHKELQDV